MDTSTSELAMIQGTSLKKWDRKTPRATIPENLLQNNLPYKWLHKQDWNNSIIKGYANMEGGEFLGSHIYYSQLFYCVVPAQDQVH